MTQNYNKKTPSETMASMQDDAADSLRSSADETRDAGSAASTMARNASEMADTMSSKLKTVGVDTDVMVNKAKDQASELQRLLGEELRTNPLRALGVAAAVGVFVGLMTAR